jgi:hypothetical protein
MDLFFNITIMSLLLVTIVYALKLNSKLNIIRNHKVELKANIEAFYTATEKANKAIKDLQKQGKELCVEIDQKVSKARLTSDEIDFLLTRARKTLLSLNEDKQTPSVAESNAQKLYNLAQQRTEPSIQSVSKPVKLTREQIIEQRLNAANKEASSNDDYLSLSEQQLLKAMRDREYKQALMG